jgi:hypothetical protein
MDVTPFSWFADLTEVHTIEICKILILENMDPNKLQQSVECLRKHNCLDGNHLNEFIQPFIAKQMSYQLKLPQQRY